MQSFSCDPKWLDIADSVWLKAFSKRHVEPFSAEIQPLIDELLTHFPQPGDQAHKPTPVVLRRGRTIGPHRHPEHLIIYYPIGHPAKLLTEFGDHILVKNTAVYLPPNALHSVERVSAKSARLSLALRWNTT